MTDFSLLLVTESVTVTKPLSRSCPTTFLAPCRVIPSSRPMAEIVEPVSAAHNLQHPPVGKSSLAEPGLRHRHVKSALITEPSTAQRRPEAPRRPGLLAVASEVALCVDQVRGHVRNISEL